MSLIDEINRASSRINRANQEFNTNVQKVTRVTGGFENAVGNYNQSISNVRRTISNTIGQFRRIQSGVRRILGTANAGQPGQAGQPGRGGGGTAGVANSTTVRGEGTSSVAGSVSEGLIGTGTVARIGRNILAGLGVINGETRRGGDFLGIFGNGVIINDNFGVNSESPYDRITRSKFNMSGNSVSFPPDLTTVVDSWMILDFYQYKRPSSDVAGNLNHQNSIMLPIPNDFAQNHSIQLDPNEIGTLALAQGAIDKLTTATRNEMAKGTEGSLEGLARGVAAEGSIQQAVTLGKYASFNLIRNSDIGGLVGQNLGQVPNPHPTVFFKGVPLRQWTWSWKFVPRSEEESRQLKYIIDIIRVRALPERDSFMLKYPSLVEPTFAGKASESMGLFKKCMISEIGVNYTPEGTSAFYYDGNPVSIVLTLGLQEVEQLLSNDVGADVSGQFFVGPRRR